MNDKKFDATIKILSALLSNPSIIQPNGMTGWGLANCTVNQLVQMAVGIVDETIIEVEGEKP